MNVPPNEIWKDIEEYEERYQVSNLGGIRSLDRMKRHNTSKSGYIKVEGKVLKPYPTKKGYLHVDMSTLDGKRKSELVHRLVAKEFIPNPKNYPQVNHINGLKDDNRVENLEWCDNSMNQLHAYKMGLNKPSEKAGKPKKPVYQIDKYTGEIIAEFPSIAEAGKTLGMKNPSNISLVCTNKRISSGGFKWKYVNSEVMPNDVK